MKKYLVIIALLLLGKVQAQTTHTGIAVSYDGNAAIVSTVKIDTTIVRQSIVQLNDVSKEDAEMYFKAQKNGVVDSLKVYSYYAPSLISGIKIINFFVCKDKNGLHIKIKNEIPSFSIVTLLPLIWILFLGIWLFSWVILLLIRGSSESGSYNLLLNFLVPITLSIIVSLGTGNTYKNKNITTWDEKYFPVLLGIIASISFFIILKKKRFGRYQRGLTISEY